MTVIKPANPAPAGSSTESPKSVTVLGSTGSVGTSTIDLLARGSFEVEALTANGNVDLLAEQGRQLGAKLCVVADEARYGDLKERLSGSGIQAAAGADAVREAAQRPADWVMGSIVGAAGLAPVLAAIERGATIGLANKETLVCAGDVVMKAVETHGATLLPVDSEHSAIFQVFDFDRPERVERLVLTASGGPFREWTREAMAAVTPEQAVAHPNWSMGAKISIDSATMMNKGLELIEAHHLFPVSEDRISILVHPQSVIHSMVDYVDGSTLAQLGSPDMRTPIAFALAWPDRMDAPTERLRLEEIGKLTFEAPDMDRFPALRLTREALISGGLAPCLLNAANEVAVAAFLDRRIGFLDIACVVEGVLERLSPPPAAGLDDILAADADARRSASEIVKTLN
ncbi:MAG: 1-deoxy-D-xylulose-5-phosphate reductoisomerase [Magnetovibrionaceae bacterium]